MFFILHTGNVVYVGVLGVYVTFFRYFLLRVICFIFFHYINIFFWKFSLKMLHWCNIWCTEDIGRKRSEYKGL